MTVLSREGIDYLRWKLRSLVSDYFPADLPEEQATTLRQIDALCEMAHRANEGADPDRCPF